MRRPGHKEKDSFGPIPCLRPARCRPEIAEKVGLLGKDKIFVLVKNFAWTNEDVELFRTAKEAERVFQQYTGFAYNDRYFDQDNEEYNEKFCETKLYELPLPDFLTFIKSKSRRR